MVEIVQGGKYCNGLTQKLVINELEETSSILFTWFYNNYMKVNSDKSHLIMSGNKSTTDIDINRIEFEDINELLRITINSNLTFESHIAKMQPKN